MDRSIYEYRTVFVHTAFEWVPPRICVGMMHTKIYRGTHWKHDKQNCACLYFYIESWKQSNVFPRAHAFVHSTQKCTADGIRIRILCTFYVQFGRWNLDTRECAPEFGFIIRCFCKLKHRWPLAPLFHQQWGVLWAQTVSPSASSSSTELRTFFGNAKSVIKPKQRAVAGLICYHIYGHALEATMKINTMNIRNWPHPQQMLPHSSSKWAKGRRKYTNG